LTIEGFRAEGDNVHLPCLSIVHVFALNTSLYRPSHHACFTTYCESQRRATDRQDHVNFITLPVIARRCANKIHRNM